MISMNTIRGLLVSLPVCHLARDVGPAVVHGCSRLRPLSACRVAGVVVAGLLAAAADAPGTPQEAVAHARAVVSKQMQDMGVDNSVFHDLQTVELPRTYGPPGLAVCGTALDADPRTQSWAMNFVAFFERGKLGWPWTMDDVMYERTDGAGTPAAADLCVGALNPARSRAVPEAHAAGTKP